MGGGFWYLVGHGWRPGSLELPMEGYSWNAARDLTEAIWQRAEELGLPGVSTPIWDRQSWTIICHSFRPGVPTINIIDFNYPHWHTVEDTPDKCSAESLEIVGRLVLDIIYSGL